MDAKRREAKRAWRVNNPDKCMEYLRIWRAKYPEKNREYARKSMAKKSAMTPAIEKCVQSNAYYNYNKYHKESPELSLIDYLGLMYLRRIDL